MLTAKELDKLQSIQARVDYHLQDHPSCSDQPCKDREFLVTVAAKLIFEHREEEMPKDGDHIILVCILCGTEDPQSGHDLVRHKVVCKECINLIINRFE